MSEETSTHEHDEFTLKEKIQYSLLGLIVIGGSFFIGKSIIRKARSTSEEKKTYDEDNAASRAQKLKMAFENDMWFGWGTDEETVRNVIKTVPSKDEFKKVINSYQKLYARSLMADLKDELTTTEYNEMLAIIAVKPERGNAPIQVQLSSTQYQSWAKRLKAAFEITYWFIPGTDEDAIKSVFLEMPTQAAFWETAKVYKALYGDDLISDLNSELEFWERGEYMSIIEKKPKA